MVPVMCVRLMPLVTSIAGRTGLETPQGNLSSQKAPIEKSYTDFNLSIKTVNNLFSDTINIIISSA
jgi:hypothetical protein